MLPQNVVNLPGCIFAVDRMNCKAKQKKNPDASSALDRFVFFSLSSSRKCVVYVVMDMDMNMDICMLKSDRK